MKTTFKKLFTFALAMSVVALFAQEKKSSHILITNVKVWDGTSENLIDADVLIKDNLISEVKKGIKAPKDIITIDGKGGTLMPGLIEGHGHLQMNGTSISDIENNRNWEELAVRSVVNAENALMSGFTSWRDAGGMGAGLKKTIDAGLVNGPRIYPSGGFIGPTGSHADFRNLTTPNETFNGPQSSGGRLGMSITADGISDIKAAVRQNFMQGASQVKIMSSGGVVSQFDPWQLDAYSAEEIRAAVETAEAYGSYVLSHAYSKKSIIRCLENGVKTIEHCFMFDGDVAALMEEKGAYMTTNMQAFSPALSQVSAISASKSSARKAESAQLAFENYVENVKKHRPKLGFQGDCVGMPEACNKQNDHQIYLGANFFGNHYYLKALTSVNGEILKLSGEVMDPYPDGKLGVIETGAYADLLIVDGNPLTNIELIGGNEKWFDAPVRDGIKGMKLIMKDGKIYKNTL
ncbi:metal-dependent hydrolase family protein [Urechidicola vernalis]|uniref:Amidohydrolase family protein n=1 Tax=Urechidicola vernalis TaxID=3075600 RepID=A0ABU2Y4R2_9FLAO|nr:amidohydrolase family protein [Urechidicola sp. P050]MDT0552780.1 amidohydrolase family protein [Urechidicola sp. P050]